VIAFRAFGIPQKAPLFTTLAHLLRTPASSRCLWLLAESSIALEISWAVAPAKFIDSLEFIFAERIAEIVGFLKSRAALTDHLPNISESGLKPACVDAGHGGLGRFMNWLDWHLRLRLLGLRRIWFHLRFG